jgi:hypothetical protein
LNPVQMSTVDIVRDVEARCDGIRYAMRAVRTRVDFWRRTARVKVRPVALVPYFLKRAPLPRLMNKLEGDQNMTSL